MKGRRRTATLTLSPMLGQPVVHIGILIATVIQSLIVHRWVWKVCVLLSTVTHKSSATGRRWQNKRKERSLERLGGCFLHCKQSLGLGVCAGALYLCIPSHSTEVLQCTSNNCLRTDCACAALGVKMRALAGAEDCRRVGQFA